MSSRRYSVTRAEVQALPRFVVSDFGDDDDDEEIIEEDSAMTQPLKSPTRISPKPPLRAPLQGIARGLTNLSVDDDDDEEEIIEEEDEEEEYEEIIEEEDDEEIIEEGPLTPPPSSILRKTPSSAPQRISSSPSTATNKKAQGRNSDRQLNESQHSTASTQDGGDNDDEESLPDAEDVLEALKYILRQEKAVEQGFITAEQEAKMLALPLSEMVDIMKHFELCDNENAPIRWDLVCLMISAVVDDPGLSDEEVVVDDEDDDDVPPDDSDNGLEAIDEVGSLGSGYDLEAKDDTCCSDLSEFNGSEVVITE